MAERLSLHRKAHFLGKKLKGLRTRNNLTLEDLSTRCLQVDRVVGPSVSYLSMIERGVRTPSVKVLQIIADVLQKEVEWFLDESLDSDITNSAPMTPVSGIALEPGFLFSASQMETTIPELLDQTGTTGIQFAQLLIRSFEESNNNIFPDIEREANITGHRRFPITVDDLRVLAKKLGLEIFWFTNSLSNKSRSDRKPSLNRLVRSFYDPPGKIYINAVLKEEPARLKYEIANHIAHKVLHDGDGARFAQVSGDLLTGRRQPDDSDTKDILFAWRDFECNYFANALLAPRAEFRKFLDKHSYSIESGSEVELTKPFVMRRMASVSQYRHWHYFDAYPPGNLRTVYRGNGIPLPYGNMAIAPDPCPHWSVFQMLGSRSKKPMSQISMLKTDYDDRLYCCISSKSSDAAGNPYVVCTGIDVSPALAAQGNDPAKVIDAINESCTKNGGSGPIPKDAKEQLNSIGKILNIQWLRESTKKNATIICRRSSSCPRDKHCRSMPPMPATLNSRIEEIKGEMAED